MFGWTKVVILVLVIQGLLVSLSWAQAPVRQLQSSYDYVIVGCGSAGSVVANRLSEDPGVTVACLEAGKDNDIHPFSKIPLLFFLNQGTDADWQYKTVPQKNVCNSMVENRSAWPSGKLLGGSGQLSTMSYVRGNRDDFDRWENEFGADGWSYADVLPYFKKSEEHTDPEFFQSGLKIKTLPRASEVNTFPYFTARWHLPWWIRKDKHNYVFTSEAPDNASYPDVFELTACEYHGDSGQWKISVADEAPELIEAYLKASEELGATVLREINGREQEAFSPNSVFIGNGARSEPAVAFLKPAMTRKNLDVLTEAHVTKVLFDGNRTIGVEYRRRGVWGNVTANREVILSAGAVGSPRILMSSGVGHRDHLEQFGIPVVADLPVGDNLQDHLMVYPFDYELDQPLSVTLSRIMSPSELANYALFREGILTATLFQALGFFRSEHQPDDDPRPFIESSLAATLLLNARFISRTFNFNEEVLEARDEHWGIAGHGFSILVGLQRPASKGTIRLQSADPFDPPLIDPKYYQEEIDVDHMLSGVRFTQQYAQTQAFKDLGVKLIDHIHPMCDHLKKDTDEYWKCFIRADTLTMYHESCTCKMGPAEDPTTVVDSQLRVHGIDGLRVIDASIMPEVPTGNTMAAVVMVAEKGSDLIRGITLPPITDL